MFKGIISNTTSAASTNLVFTPTIQSNPNAVWKSSTDTVQIPKGGYFEIDVQLVLTDVAAGDITTSLLANGSSLTEAQAIYTSAATTDYNTVSLHDVVKVYPQTSADFVEIGVQLSASATITSGVIVIKEVR